MTIVSRITWTMASAVFRYSYRSPRRRAVTFASARTAARNLGCRLRMASQYQAVSWPSRIPSSPRRQDSTVLRRPRGPAPVLSVMGTRASQTRNGMYSGDRCDGAKSQHSSA